MPPVLHRYVGIDEGLLKVATSTGENRLGRWRLTLSASSVMQVGPRFKRRRAIQRRLAARDGPNLLEMMVVTTGVNVSQRVNTVISQGFVREIIGASVYRP